MMTSLKQRYLRFLEKDKRNLLGSAFYSFLYILSYVYGTIVAFRNFLYNTKVIPSYSCDAKIISVGNISWSGSGKTPLSIWLYTKFSSLFRTAVLRRGYGDDENKLLKEKINNVFYLSDRYKLAKELSPSFDIFIIDDGFQYRRLQRDINIVIMGAREFKKKHRLIPAYFFREPISALKRADIVILNYADDFEDRYMIKNYILKIAPHLKIYFSQYKFKKFSDLNGKEFSRSLLGNRKIAAFAAIGYPQGFFNKLKALNLDIRRKIIYPDHYELSGKEFTDIQENLIKSGISDLVITHKDKYHFPHEMVKMNVVIMEIEMEIENGHDLITEINKKLKMNQIDGQ